MGDLRNLIRFDGAYILRRGYAFMGRCGWDYSGNLDSVAVIESLNQARLAATFNAPCEVWRSWGHADQQMIMVCANGTAGVQWVTD
jgi:hypothetical protein